METKDFKNAKGDTVDRLTAVKEVLNDFLSRRQGDCVGLIFFGSAPFVQAPFTEDLKVCRQLLDEAQVKMAGPQTAFGDALGLAINVFERSPVKERILIALTDGNDTASQVPPAKAAQIAKDEGIIIHTVSVGDPMAAGEDALDVDTLKAVATTSGGLYAHAEDRQQLEEIYRKIDALETRKGGNDQPSAKARCILVAAGSRFRRVALATCASTDRQPSSFSFIVFECRRHRSRTTTRDEDAKT
jgi:Ca-activated chloride channel family protein